MAHYNYEILIPIFFEILSFLFLAKGCTKIGLQRHPNRSNPIKSTQDTLGEEELKYTKKIYNNQIVLIS